jgi:hypothetical protein
MGFTLGKIRPDMKPEFLINNTWWNEPQVVQQENHIHYMQCFNRLYNDLPIFPISLEPTVAELD